MDVALRHRGRIITTTDIEFIRRLIINNPGDSRRRLSEKLCEAWNWRQSNGSLRAMVCRSMMLQLHRAGHIELPPVRHVAHNPLAQRSKPSVVPVDQTASSLFRMDSRGERIGQIEVEFG
jgi:hypothetical protein